MIYWLDAAAMSEARPWRGQVRKGKRQARAKAAEVIIENGGPGLANIRQSMQHLSGSISEDDIAILVRQLGYVPTNLVAIAARGIRLYAHNCALKSITLAISALLPSPCHAF